MASNDRYNVLALCDESSSREDELFVLDRDGKSPESKLHGVKIEELPVKNYHPLFCPVYVLDHRLHSAGGAGPTK